MLVPPMQACHACTAILSGPGCVVFPHQIHSFDQQHAKEQWNRPVFLETGLVAITAFRFLLCKDIRASITALQKPWPWLAAMEKVPGAIKQLFPGHTHRPRPEGSTPRCMRCLCSRIFMLHLCCIRFFKGLQDDQPAPTTKSHLKITRVFKGEEWALQTAES